VDGNQDDKITFFHEAPPGMFSSSRNKNNDTTMEAMFKELLTSMRVAVKTIYMREDGKRETRTADCSHIGCFFCATNDDPEYCEEALRTRFYWGIFPKKDRSGRDIDDCQNGKRNMSKDDTVYETQMRNYFKIEQYRVWMIEQLIRCNIIQDVDMTVANTMLQQVKTELHNRGIHASSTRDWERVKYLCRCLCIPTALDIVFNLDSSPYKDVPFEVEQLLAVEPHLYVTEEIFMFAFSLMSTQFCSSIEHKVLSKLFNLHKLMQNRFGDDRGEIGPDYIQLKKKVQLSKYLQNNMDTSEGKTSLHHINAMLNKLTETSFSTKSYMRMQDGVSGFPAEDPDSPTTVQQCAHATLDNFYIHVGYIMKHANKAHDPVVDVIRSLNFENSTEKQMIIARAQGNSTPYKMKFVRRTQGSKHMEFNNVLFNTQQDRMILGTDQEENANRKRRKTVFTEDIDDVARQRRSKNIACGDIYPVMCTDGVISIKDY
jgi:histone H3/H4